MASSTANSNFHTGSSNFHKGNFHAGSTNFHSGNYHSGNVGETKSNFHAGNFHVGKANNFHAGELNEINFHSGISSAFSNFHGGEPGNFHSGNFHIGEKDTSRNFHSGEGADFHSRNLAMDSNFHGGNYHAGCSNDENFHVSETAFPHSKGIVADAHSSNFHGGNPFELQAINLEALEPEHISKDFTTNINFYASTADAKKAYNYVEKPADSNVYSNVLTSEHLIKVTDIRGRENELNLDQNAVLTVSGIPDASHFFTENTQVTEKFYPVVEQILLDKVPGAQRVFIFDHTIRRKYGDRGPVMRAHIDQTPASALARVERHLPEEAASLLSGRVRLINFWRPLNGTVENYPLAFADSNSVLDEDLETVEHRYPEWTGETFGVKHRRSQKWFYWSGMTNNEALLLQCFDSEKGGRLPHSAVMDPDSRSTKVRESIEIRALIFG